MDAIEDPSAPLDLEGAALHFVGIGGAGMSGLARIARSLGATVTGTDQSASPATEALITEGIEVTLRQEAGTVPPDCDAVVISAAIGEDHPEVAEARRRRTPVLKYAQLLGRLMLGRTGVAIAGTHGKSTTTAMLAHALIQAEADPTFIVGATCEQIGGGARAGRPDLLIGEACEYDRSFHNFHPTHSAVLNIEADHLDVYGSLDAIVESFHEFAQNTHPDGSLLIGHEGAHRTDVAAGLPCNVETIGFSPQADWQVQVTHVARPNGGGHSPAQRVVIHRAGQPVCEFYSPLPGEHMAYNASVAAVTANRLGASWARIGEALSSFRGLDRRMQKVATVGGVTVIDDYGHHPTEIDTTLRALRAHHRPEAEGGRLLCVFQPHQHSRTRFLLDQFAVSFHEADRVIVPSIYFVRDSEQDRRAVCAEDLVERLKANGTEAVHVDGFDRIAAYLQGEARPGDLLVVMGAGPVWQVAHRFAGLG